MRANRSRVLVLSDKEILCTSLVDALADHDCLQEQLSDLISVRSAILSARPHLVILDVNFWTKTISDLLWTLGENALSPDVRKMVICNRATVEEKVEALEVGVDQFLLKPISTRELRAHINALLRSSSSRPEAQVLVSVGDLTIDRRAMSVAVGGEPRRLTATEFALLEFLAMRDGQIVSRQELLQNVWSSIQDDPDTRLVEVYIYRLRGKIEIDASVPRRLLQFRGKGYMLIDPESSTRYVVKD